jgi:hypothetical protein
MKCLGLDNGGEYVGKDFESYLSLANICTLHTSIECIAKRKKWILVEMAHCLLQAKGPSTKFCVDVVYCSNYLLNLIPTKVVWNVTPIEKWSGRKPSIGHLGIFGCIAWAHIPIDRRKKLDAKNLACIMMSYSEELKAYR